MALLVGTDQGVYRADGVPFEADGLERVADCGTTHQVRRFRDADGVYAAAADGLFRSTDGGRTWTDLGLPCAGDDAVHSVLATASGALYAGTNYPSLFRSTDGGDGWTELRTFRELPSRGLWQSPISRNRARLRALESPPGFPDTIVAGVEVGGFHVSRDGGETWTDRRGNGQDDVHSVLALGRDVYVAATGHYDLDLEDLGVGHALGFGGVHRTTDAGRSWTRVDPANVFTYSRALLLHDETLLWSGATAAPGSWFAEGVEAALFESSGLGRTYERVGYPGEPGEIVEAMASLDGDVLCGTAAHPPAGDVGGHVLRRSAPGEYERVGGVPAAIKSLVVA